MSLSYPTVAIRNALADYACALANGGSIEILTSANASLVSLPLSATAFGAASNGVATANAITAGTASAAGTAAKGRVKKSDGTVIWECTVGTSGADINLNSTTVQQSQQVSITSLTYTAPV